jgi:CRISPR-associated endonuclease Cas2
MKLKEKARMPHYIIAYDVSTDAAQDEEYKNLEDALTNMGAQRVQESVFIVNASHTAKQIATGLAAQIKDKSTNRLFVAEINENTSYRFPLNEDDMAVFFGDPISKPPKLVVPMTPHPLGKK